MTTFSISSNRSLGTNPEAGTLLWIGERDTADFRAAYEFCEANASQIAFRTSLHEALQRPASAVQQIIVACVDRHPHASDELELVAARHNHARWLALEGPLCSGATRRVLSQSPSEHMPREFCYLHQWRQHLPGWLTGRSHSPNTTTLSLPSNTSSLPTLAIIAASHNEADTLLDLADSCGCSAVWFRSPHASRMRNVDVVWWDDSAAPETTSELWQQRLSPSTSRPFRNSSVHVWLTHSTCWSTIDQAYAGGVASVLTKPFQIHALLETLSLAAAQSHAFHEHASARRTAA